MRTFGLPLGALLVLACGGLGVDQPSAEAPAPMPVAVEPALPSPSPALPAPTPAPPEPEPLPVRPRSPSSPAVLLVPTDTGAGCRFDLSSGRSLGTVKGGCKGWAVSAHPTDPERLVLRTAQDRQVLGSAPPAPPSIPDTTLDGLGYASDGRLVATLYRSVEPELDPAAQTATVVLDGVRHPMEFHMAEMFGIVACEHHVYDGNSWSTAGPAAPVQLEEGMPQPWCASVPGGPAVLEPDQVTNLGGDPQQPARHAPRPTLVAGEYATWHFLEPDLAVGTIDFGGQLVNGRVAFHDGTTWTVLEGLTEADGMAALHRRGPHLLVCVDGRAHLYDAGDHFRRTWTHEGACPAFWPVGS